MSHEGIRIVSAEQAQRGECTRRASDRCGDSEEGAREKDRGERESRSTGRMGIRASGTLRGCGMLALALLAMRIGRRRAGCPAWLSQKSRRCW